MDLEKFIFSKDNMMIPIEKDAANSQILISLGAPQQQSPKPTRRFYRLLFFSKNT